MKRYWLQGVFVLSVVLNLGVLGAVGYDLLRTAHSPDPLHGGHLDLADHLRLSVEQRRQWQAMEVDFMRGLDAAWVEIRERRERMVREIFSDRPDRGTIETERAAIARLQEQQQQRIIEQLMAERGVLDARQRQALAEILIQQEPADKAMVERLHGK